MNIMTGYLGATEGEVLINGHDILKEPEEAKKQIGYLPELPPLYMEMTVREYLEFVAELKGIAKKKREESINEVEKMVKIWEVENRLIKNLSKGYRQRVGLAHLPAIHFRHHHIGYKYIRMKFEEFLSQ